jgi:hypothetical protein
MPCRHGRKPTVSWRPTGPCSTLMYGRCCGESMRKSRPESWALPRRQCQTCPSWRRRRALSANSKDGRQCLRLRWRSPLPCSRASRLRRSQGRPKQRQIGKLPRARRKPLNRDRSRSPSFNRTHSPSHRLSGRSQGERRAQLHLVAFHRRAARRLRRSARLEPRHHRSNLIPARPHRRGRHRSKRSRHAKPLHGMRW